MAANYTCAFSSGGPLKCWGTIPSGVAPSNATSSTFSRTASVFVWDAGVVDVALNAQFLCVLLSSGAVECSGNPLAAFNEASTGTAQVMLGRAVSGLPAGVSRVDPVAGGTCALTDAGATWCWGAMGFGLPASGTPLELPALAGTVALAYAGGTTCALGESGAVSCLGNSTEYLPRPTDGGNLHTTPYVIFDAGAVEQAVGNDHVCVRIGDGGVLCWGDPGGPNPGFPNDCGLGDGISMSSATPVAVVGLVGRAVSLSAASTHTCAVTDQGQVRCWGCNGSGQLGDGTLAERVTPTPILVGSTPFRQVSTSSSSTCAARLDGGAMCWGYNLSGQLGRASGFLTNQNPTPALVDGL